MCVGVYTAGASSLACCLAFLLLYKTINKWHNVITVICFFLLMILWYVNVIDKILTYCPLKFVKRYFAVFKAMPTTFTFNSIQHYLSKLINRSTITFSAQGCADVWFLAFFVCQEFFFVCLGIERGIEQHLLNYHCIKVEHFLYCDHLPWYFEIPSEAQMRGLADETKYHNIFDKMLHMATILFSDSWLALEQIQYTDDMKSH